MTRDDVATPAYRSVLQKRYTYPGWGASGYTWADVVQKFAYQLKASTILDYGCGRGTLALALPAWDVSEYDPGIIGKDSMPKPADLVVATDVLEHIEPVMLANVLAHLKSLALKGLFLNIATGPAKEILPDGRNAHLIQRPSDWWYSRLQVAGFTIDRFVKAKGFNVWIIL